MPHYDKHLPNVEKLPLQNHNHPRRTLGLDEFMDEQYHRVVVPGVDFADHDSDELTVGADVQTTVLWALENECPQLRGVIRKIKYRDGQTAALIAPFGPWPAARAQNGVWFPIEDLERATDA